jgi:hypothetical protein
MARRRSRKTPVSSPSKIDVVVKKAIPAPVEVAVVEVVPPSPEEMAWREDVWALRTTGAVGEQHSMSSVNPLIVDVWREDVVAGVTSLSLAQWLKQN